MTTVIQPTQEQWEVLQSLGLTGLKEENVVIISPEITRLLERQYGEDLPDLLVHAQAFYDCGGEADIWLDVAESDGHYLNIVMADWYEENQKQGS